MYDIYLSSGCLRRPELSSLAIHITSHNLAEMYPGFLGLNISGDMADELLGQLTLAGGRGLVVPAAYRQPKVTLEMARAIAQQAITQKQKEHSYTFGSVQFLSEDAYWWKFGAASPELLERRYIPGAMIMLVDKLNGHLWTDKELSILNGEEYYLASASTLSPEQILHLLADKLTLEWGTDYRHGNGPCLKGPAFIVSASQHSYPAFIEKRVGFRPTVQIYFRLQPYKNGYESATLLLLQAVMEVFHYDGQDAVLQNDDTSAPLLFQCSKQLILGKGWENWSESQPVSRRALTDIICESDIVQAFQKALNNRHPAPRQVRRERVMATEI